MQPSTLPTLQTNEEVPHPSYPPRMQKWLDLCREYHYLAFTCQLCKRETPPPPPLHKEFFLALVGSLYDHEQCQVLREVLLDLLGDGIAAIATAVVESEVHR